jgi:transposase InsO family protein
MRRTGFHGGSGARIRSSLRGARDGASQEVIRDRVWRTQTQLEHAITGYIGWYNQTRLHEALGDLPPAEYEALAA